MKSNDQCIVKKYKLMCFICLTPIWVIIVLSILFIKNIGISIVMITLAYFLSNFIIVKLSQKYIMSILFEDLDAFKFQNMICNNKYLSKDNDYLLIASLYSGDYQTVVNICEKKLCDKATIKKKYMYLNFLAHAYFQLRDDQKLSEVCTSFDQLVSADKNKDLVVKQFPSMFFYSCFLNKDYEKCKDICHEEVYLQTNVLQTMSEFNFAVACLKNKELHMAECSFKKVIDKAPKMYFCKLSKQYLQEIKGTYKGNTSDDFLD